MRTIFIYQIFQQRISTEIEKLYKAHIININIGAKI